MKTSASYMVSRFNGMKFGIQRKGVMPCLGSAKCQQRYCDGVCSPPSDGSPCPWETAYARRLEEEFRERYNALAIIPDVDDFEDLVREHVNIYLQRTRAMTRLNRAWDKRTDDGRLSPEAYDEFEITELYLDRLAARESRLQGKLEGGLDRMRERAERLRPHLQAMEIFVAARKAAVEDLQGAPELVWDEFIDGDRTPERQITDPQSK